VAPKAHRSLKKARKIWGAQDMGGGRLGPFGNPSKAYGYENHDGY